MDDCVKRSSDWDFPMPPMLSDAIDEFVDALDERRRTGDARIDIADYICEIDGCSRVLDDEHEKIIRDYYL